MDYKSIVPCLYLYRGQAVTGWENREPFEGGDALELAGFYSDGGADELLAFDLSSTDEEHEEAIGKIREICQASQIPVTAAGNVKRLEDVKKLLYAGCRRVALNFSKESNVNLLEEASERFGKEKILACVSRAEEFMAHQDSIERYADGVLLVKSALKEVYKVPPVSLIFHMESDAKSDALACMEERGVDGVSGGFVSRKDVSLVDFKQECQELGIPVNLLKSKIAWSDFKLNGDGLIPVMVQDYQTDEALMLAYMNQEAFHKTLKTGKMTYWSRSRGELWVKGETSGHFQYVKSLMLDCDNDTILAKVAQVGAACHTGNYSCFFKELVKKEYDDANPLRVFQDVYDVILDRKIHPKEGSYTNYLFEKGIDKILKKVGEECTEIVIAAKNPDKEEIKYEIADFLYHVMVLMAEKEVSWEDITRELARR